MAHYFQQVLKMNIDEINGQCWQVWNKWCKKYVYYIFKTFSLDDDATKLLRKKTLVVRNNTIQMNKKSLHFCINKCSITWRFVYLLRPVVWRVSDWYFCATFWILSGDGLFSQGSNCPLLNNVTKVHRWVWASNSWMLINDD